MDEGYLRIPTETEPPRILMIPQYLVMVLYMHKSRDYILTGILTKSLKLKCKYTAEFEV